MLPTTRCHRCLPSSVFRCSQCCIAALGAVARSIGLVPAPLPLAPVTVHASLMGLPQPA